MSSTDLNPSCPVNNLALHRLDLEEVKGETTEPDLEQTAEENRYLQVKKEVSGGGGRAEEDGHGGKLVQNEPAYSNLRRSIARQEHEATEAQRPHSSHGCQSTDTSISQSHTPHNSVALHPRPRARSPYSWSTYRSHSASMISTSPPPHMQRQPQALSRSPTLRPISPFRPPGRVRSPFRSSQLSEEQPFGAEFASISEDSELEITPRSFPANSSTSNHGYNTSYLHRCSSSPCSSSTSSSSITRSRRPNSPMRHVSAPTSAHSSPLLAPAPTPIPNRSNYPNHYNESYPLSLSTSSAASSSYYSTTMMGTPTLTNLSSSSVPSTPTSTRSRSPSISSLETIPDSPRAEKEAEAALAAAEEAAMTAAAAAADAHQTSENITTAGGSAGVTPRISSGSGSGSGIALRDKRKRWSVCGAESRRDLDLETIWEDQNI